MVRDPLIVAFDFETHLIRPGLQAPPIVCMSWQHAGSDLQHVYAREDAGTLLEQWLNDGKIFVGCNTAFDMICAMAQWPRLIPKIFAAYDQDRIRDVAIRHSLACIAGGERHAQTSLAAIVKDYFGDNLDKGADTYRTRYAELDGVPIADWPQAAIDYAKADARYTSRAYEYQQDSAALSDLYFDEPAQCRADLSLKLMSAWGLRTSAEGVTALRTQCEREQRSHAEILIDAGLLAANGKRSTIRTRERMQKVLGVLAPRTEKGNIKIDEEACRDSGDPVLEAFAEYSTVSSLLSGHVKAMEEGITYPIHSRFSVLLATGRTASSAPNVQNVRRAPGARECFIPRKGWAFVACDFGKAELHTLAQVCLSVLGHSSLATALNAGFDPHLGLGAALAGLTYEQAKARVNEPEIIEWRQRAKVANFGFPGGMGPGGLVAYAKSNYGVILSVAEARTLHDAWRTQWPELPEYLRWSEVQGPLVQHLVSRRWRGDCTYCSSANTRFQGLAADAAKAALYEVTKLCYNDPTAYLFGCRPVNFIHDEILIEAPIDRVHDAATSLRALMVDTFNKYTPDVPVSAEPVAMAYWSKKAKPIYRDGRLQIWS